MKWDMCKKVQKCRIRTSDLWMTAPLQSNALPTELGLGEDRLTEGGKRGKKEKMGKNGRKNEERRGKKGKRKAKKEKKEEGP